MPRNGSGTFSYADPDFSANTVISSSVMNTKLTDVSTALTGSIAKDGQTTTSAVIPFASGLSADTIAELTSAAGVTVDAVLLKDGRIDTNQGADIASASTVNLETATGNVVDVTGTTTITAVTLSQGHWRWVRFTGILTLTHGASLVLPGGANITTAAGDYALFIGYGSSVVRCATYVRIAAVAITGPGSSVSGNVVTWSGTAGAVLADGGVAPLGQGLHTIYIPASTMVARTTNGAASGSSETSTNKVMLKTLDFDATTIEYAQFNIRMPKSWDEGTVTAVFTWTHGATTTNFGVSWGIQGVALSNDDAADTAFGTAIYANDTGGTTNDIYISPTTAAITIAGTPAAEDWVVFQVLRKADDGTNDTLAVDAKLLGVTMYFTVNASTDA
jgi:hypothetical protein